MSPNSNGSKNSMLHSPAFSNFSKSQLYWSPSFFISSGVSSRVMKRPFSFFWSPSQMNWSRSVVLAVPADPEIRVTDGRGRPPQTSLSSPLQPVVVLSISKLIANYWGNLYI